MENEINEIQTDVDNRLEYTVFASIGLLIFLFGLLFDFQPVNRTVLSRQIEADMPQFGWNVTDDLGVGDVPGGPTAQRFELRQDDGWEVLAYCLDPDETAPPVGTPCELINENTFWCGDEFQQLQEYELVQQPPPQQEETPTATATSTSTVTPTSTMTATSIPTSTSVPPQSATPTPRPKMGGSGNFSIGDAISLILGFSMIGIGILMSVVDWKRFLSKFN